MCYRCAVYFGAEAEANAACARRNNSEQTVTVRKVSIARLPRFIGPPTEYKKGTLWSEYIHC